MPKKKKDLLEILGIIMIFLGFAIILSAFPGPASIVGVPGIKIEVSPIVAGRLAVGCVLVVMGVLLYHHKKLIKLISK